MERTAIERLRGWKNSADRKTLIIRGARQVGKTTLVNQFSKEFDCYLYLNKGRIAEHITAQELIANDFEFSSRRFFWVRDKENSSAEVDFVFRWKNMMIPVEVKSGNNSKLKSLHIFMDGVSHDIAVRVWPEPFSVDKVKTQNGKEFRLVNLPFYYVGILEKVSDNFIG